MILITVFFIIFFYRFRKITKETLRLSKYNTGERGEILLEEELTNNIIGYTKILKNLYIPHNGKTTEIDLVLLTESYIFVYESKNYSGWIYGNENNKQWSQIFGNGKRYNFFNPIFQNNAHISALSNLLKIEQDKFKSYIVFSNRCTLRNIPEETAKAKIIQRYQVVQKTNSELENAPQGFNIIEIERIYGHLSCYQYQYTDEETKQKHIKYIQNIKNKPKI